MTGTTKTLSITGSGLAGSSQSDATTGITALLTSAGLGTQLNDGALRVLGGGSVNWNPNVTIGADNTVIATDAGSNLTLGGAINFGTSLNTVKAGTGTLTLAGATPNALTTGGNFFVNQGTLVLNKSGANAALPTPMSLFVGDTLGGNDADVVTYGPVAGANQIGDASAVTVFGSGRLDLTAPTLIVTEIQGANLLRRDHRRRVPVAIQRQPDDRRYHLQRRPRHAGRQHPGPARCDLWRRQHAGNAATRQRVHDHFPGQPGQCQPRPTGGHQQHPGWRHGRSHLAARRRRQHGANAGPVGRRGLGYPHVQWRAGDLLTRCAVQHADRGRRAGQPELDSHPGRQCGRDRGRCGPRRPHLHDPLYQCPGQRQHTRDLADHGRCRCHGHSRRRVGRGWQRHPTTHVRRHDHGRHLYDHVQRLHDDANRLQPGPRDAGGQYPGRARLRCSPSAPAIRW